MNCISCYWALYLKMTIYIFHFRKIYTNDMCFGFQSVECVIFIFIDCTWRSECLISDSGGNTLILPYYWSADVGNVVVKVKLFVVTFAFFSFAKYFRETWEIRLCSIRRHPSNLVLLVTPKPNDKNAISNQLKCFWQLSPLSWRSTAHLIYM